MGRRPAGGAAYRAAKRIGDVVGAALGLVLASPVMVVAAIAIRILMGPPVLFRHERPGKDGQPFVLLKFRTMTDERDETGRLKPSSLRLTGLGRLLRNTSIDELPQLLNVLRGDMSLVGPRPLLVEYLESYTPEQARRHLVRPGMTGWAQVNGRSALSWEQRFDCDTYYVDHRSLGLDLRILFMTVGQVVSRQKTTPGDSEIMPRFTGSGSSRTVPGTTHETGEES